MASDVLILFIYSTATLLWCGMLALIFYFTAVILWVHKIFTFVPTAPIHAYDCCRIHICFFQEKSFLPGMHHWIHFPFKNDIIIVVVHFYHMLIPIPYFLNPISFWHLPTLNGESSIDMFFHPNCQLELRHENSEPDNDNVPKDCCGAQSHWLQKMAQG